MMTLVTDPFDKKMVGLPLPKLSAEIVVVSHDHGDHNAVSVVGPGKNREEVFVVDRPGEYEVGGVGVSTIQTWHDDKKGKERGDNLVSVIQMDGVLVVHLGDLGHVLSDAQVSLIGPVDVLLVPVGGVYTIGYSEAVSVIEQLSPSIVVPMHYKKPGMAASFAELITVDEFLEKAAFGEARKEDKLLVKKGNLPEEMEIVVLE